MVPEARLAPKRTVIPIAHPRLQGYNPLDLVAMGYLALTGIILAFGLERIQGGWAYLLIHIGAVVAIALLRFVPRRGHILLQFLRDTYPLWTLPLLYKELGVLCHAVWPGYFDSTVLGWERAVFGLFPSLHLHDWIPSRFLSEFLHFSYLSYYALVPILVFRLYLRGRTEVCRVFATTVMLTFFTSYLVFILFPVAGPYYVLPRVPADGGFFAPLVHRILDGGSSRGTAFPSSHVAGAVTVLWMTARFEKPLVPLMGLLCVGIFLGTVYGGFHYGVDAIAGLILAVLVSLAGPRIHSWLLRRARLWPLRIRFPERFGPLVRTLWRVRRPRKSTLRKRIAR